MRIVPALVVGAAASVLGAGLQAPGTELSARLAAHPALSKLVFFERTDFEPAVLAFQQPDPRYTRGFEQELAVKRAPWVQRVVHNFARAYVDGSGLSRRADRPKPALVVLWQQTDYAAYRKDAAETDAFADLAWYDRSLGAAVGFEYGGQVLAAHWKRWPELAQVVEGELDAYAVRADVRVPHWVAEGLGAYLAGHQGTEVESLDAHKLDVTAVKKVVLTAHDLGLRNATLLPLQSMFDARTYEEHRAALIRKAGPAAEKLVKPKDMLEIVQSQAWTLTHFLHEAEGGKYRAGFVAFLRSALKGDGSYSAFRSALGAESGGIEGAYYKWIFEQYAALVPNARTDPTALAGLTGERAAGGPARPAAASFDPTTLALATDEAEARLATILLDIRAGKLEAALLELEALQHQPKLGDVEPRVLREILRCRKFVALRDQHLLALAAAGGKMSLEHQGKKLTVKVKSFADGKLHFEENKAKLENLPVAELDPYELAKAMDKSLSEGPDGWARWYPYVLAGDAKALKALKGSNEASELKLDAESFYPAAFRLGQGTRLLEQIGAEGEPLDAAQAKQCLASVERLQRDFGELAPVARRRAGLQALATKALRRLWDPAKLGETTAAKVEDLGDARVRLTYEFEKQEEGEDFAADHGYFAHWRKNLGDQFVAPSPTMSLDRGALRTSGAACWRHAWNFEAPIVVRYEVSFDGLSDDPRRTPLFAWAVCDDRAENFIWCQGFGSLYANDANAGFAKSESITVGKRIEGGDIYRLELEVREGVVTTREGGEDVKRFTGVPHQRGGMFLFVHSDPVVALENLVIEGKPDLQGIQENWIAKRLAAIGL
jgi:hypothetical protein